MESIYKFYFRCGRHEGHVKATNMAAAAQEVARYVKSREAAGVTEGRINLVHDAATHGIEYKPVEFSHLCGGRLTYRSREAAGDIHLWLIISGLNR